MSKEKIRVGYKFVSDELKSRNGNLTWVIDEWQQCKGNLELCNNGLHASPTPLDSLQYTYGNRWFKVEARGEIKDGDDKFVAREMRLLQEIPVKEVLVQFAILCARRCYKNYKAKYPSDTVVIGAIEATEKYLKNPTPENKSAAWSAESAAWSAESAARSAESAAWSAARSAESAARSAERKWQQKTLQKLIRKHTKNPLQSISTEKQNGGK